MSFASSPFASTTLAGSVSASGVPTAYIVGRSTVTFYGASFVESTMEISGGSLVLAAHPVRDLGIQTASSPLFRAGSIARVSAASTPEIFAKGLLNTSYSFASGAALNVDYSLTCSSKFNETKSKSVARFAGAFNFDTAIRIFGKSTFSPKSMPIKNSVVSISGKSEVRLFRNAVSVSAFSSVGQSATGFIFSAEHRSQFSMPCGSSVQPFGLPAVCGATNIAGYSTVMFYSDFSYNPPSGQAESDYSVSVTTTRNIVYAEEA